MYFEFLEYYRKVLQICSSAEEDEEDEEEEEKDEDKPEPIRLQMV